MNTTYKTAAEILADAPKITGTLGQPRAEHPAGTGKTNSTIRIPGTGEVERSELEGDGEIRLTVRASYEVKYAECCDRDPEAPDVLEPVSVSWHGVRVWVSTYGGPAVEITAKYNEDRRNYSAVIGTTLMDDAQSVLDSMECDVLKAA